MGQCARKPQEPQGGTPVKTSGEPPIARQGRTARFLPRAVGTLIIGSTVERPGCLVLSNNLRGFLEVAFDKSDLHRFSIERTPDLTDQ